MNPANPNKHLLSSGSTCVPCLSTHQSHHSSQKLPCHHAKLVSSVPRISPIPTASSHAALPGTAYDPSDDQTVITSNNSTTAGSSWTSTSSCHRRRYNPTAARTSVLSAACPQTHRPVTKTHHTNYYHALDLFDDSSIAVDSGASDGFGDEDTPGTDRRPTTHGITMASATGDCKTSIATDKFDLPLPKQCLDFHVFKRGDVQRPLLSVGKACDAGCDVHFNKTTCKFLKNGIELLRGYRDPYTGLYLLPNNSRRKHPPALSSSETAAPSHHSLSAYEQQSVPQLMRYLHACAGFPVTKTWLQAINKGYYITWPGLTPSRVRRYLPKSEETALGHLRLVRQHTRGTSKGDAQTSKGGDDKKPSPRNSTTTTPRASSSPPTTNRPTTRSMTSKGAPEQQEEETGSGGGRQRNVSVCSVPLKELKGIIGTDQTGRFPITSRRGHKYMFILCDMDTDFIYGVPIKSRKTGELLRAYDEAYTTLTTCGFKPVLHRIDHETSAELIKAISSKGLKYEIMPPSNHRQNPAERAIQTFKAHFISIINGIDQEYPSDGWDLLMPQVNMTLNMLRSCGVNPAHSAYSFIYGAFDFNKHPLAPLGCRAIVHQRSIANGGKRGSWGNRGKIGYYIGPAMNSYRTWRFYIPETKSIQESDTAEFFPQIPLPTVSVASQIAASLDTIERALDKPIARHTDITENQQVDKVIARLRSMYSKQTPPVSQTGSNTRATNGEAPTAARQEKPTNDPPPVTPPRVQPTKMNQYRPKKKQRFPIGTRVRVKEKRKTYIGKATKYDPYEGLYYVEFEDGEFEEFNDDEMAYFRLEKPRSARQPTTSANQLTVAGFFPKAGPAPRSQFCQLGERYGHLYGLNAGSIWDEELHKWMAYRDLIKHPNPKIRKRWEQAGNNEFARLAQGYGDVEGLNVITFIAKRDLPDGKQVTYARYVVDYRPEKDEPWRLRITCGGDKLDYHGDTTTHSASMETIKCHLNNIVSSIKAKGATGDISNMYLGSLLPEAEYVRFRISLIPKEFIEAYNLQELATPDGYIYARVNKAWYGLKQAGKIAHDDLVERLAEAGYKKAGLVEGYFKHETRNIDFTLVVDDFLIKYEKDEDLEHLRESLGKYYKFKVDLEAKQYVGINLKWDYVNRTVRLSMDGYVEQALKEFEHMAPKTPHHAPSRYILPNFGQRIQFVKVDETAPLGKDKIRFIQKVVGKLLYYARAVDPTMLHAINDISLKATKGTEATLDATMYLLNYAHTHPNTELIYRKSDMVLRVDSDAAYLVAPEARSRAGGYQYLSNKEGTIFNGPVLVLAKVIQNVMASAAEAELGALFMNAQEAVALRNCLEAMGYPQPATPLKTDNSTACGILNNTMKQKRSKAIDVRFYWLRDRAKQGQFYIYWESGKNNLGDYHTKKHPPQYHKQMRPIQTYIEGLSPESLQGCIKIMNGGQTSKVRAQPLNSKTALATALTATWMRRLWPATSRVALAHNIR